MKPEEHKALITEIMENLNDQAKVSTLLSDLSTDYNEMTSTVITALKSAETLTSENEKLLHANMQLFLKVGEPKKDEPQTQHKDETPKFEDLFDANGNLK